MDQDEDVVIDRPTVLSWADMFDLDVRASLGVGGGDAANGVVRAISCLADEANRILGDDGLERGATLSIDACRSVEAELWNWPEDRLQAFLVATTAVLLSDYDGPYRAADLLADFVGTTQALWAHTQLRTSRPSGDFSELARETGLLRNEAQRLLEESELDEDR